MFRTRATANTDKMSSATTAQAIRAISSRRPDRAVFPSNFRVSSAMGGSP